MRTGRPSKIKDEYLEQVNKLCKLGATDEQIADFFNVTKQTIDNWKKSNPDFFCSLKDGKAEFDARVEKALALRAIGYEGKEAKVTFEDGKADYIEIPKYYPPDTTACIFWLKNRKPDEWREKITQELTGADGAKLMPEKIIIEIVDPKKPKKG